VTPKHARTTRISLEGIEAEVVVPRHDASALPARSAPATKIYQRVRCEMISSETIGNRQIPASVGTGVY
jgi:hypothetical protein